MLVEIALKAYESTFDKGDILNFPHTFIDNNYVAVAAFAALALRALSFCPQALKK